MVISEHHINNVLRVYGDQLRQSIISSRPEDTHAGEPEKIRISATSRRETILEDITANIIEKITRSVPHDNVEKEVFKKLENKREKPLVINEDRLNKLIFKEIDENGETINSLSIKNSRFFSNKFVVKK